MTLNMLRPCRLNPKMSAYCSLEGEFSYNHTPLAPLGAKIIAHDSNDTRKSWAPHGHYVWLIGPALEHYRCLKVCNPKTKAVSIAHTFHWSEDNTFTVPKITQEEQVVRAARDLATAIKFNKNLALPQPTWQQNIDKLCSLFNSRADAILQNIPAPSPRVKTSKSNAEAPRVKEVEDDMPPDLIDEPEDEPVLHENTPTRDVTKIFNNVAKSSSNIISARTVAEHRYPTRAKRCIIANQLEANQLKEPGDVTIKPIIDATEIPSFRYDHLIKGEDKAIWENSFCREIGRLAQGHKDVKGKNTIFPIARSAVPPKKRVTHGRLVCDIRPQKKETHRVRLTAGGNLIVCNGTTSTPTAAIPTIKTHWNSAVSTPNARYLTLDIKDFYLNSKLDDFEHMRLPYHLFPQELIDLYNLDNIVANDGYVHWKAQGGMHGLPQAGILAHIKLKNYLKPFGHEPVKFTPGLWVNKEQNISFTLVLDDFGVKCTDFKNAKHLIDALEKEYIITIDMSGSLYCGVTLKWNHTDRWVNCSMPGQMPKLLQALQHPDPTTPCYAPCPAPEIKCGQRIQAAIGDDNAPILAKKENTLVRRIIGSVFFFARMLDLTLLMPVNDLALQQSNSTTTTLNLCTWLLNSIATYPNPSITFKKSDMILWISSDSSYLSVPKARSRVGGHHFLGNMHDPTKPIAKQRSEINAPVHAEASILRNVMSAASESEIAAAHVNARIGAPLRIALMELGHPQPPTPLEIDNTTSHGILTKSLLPKRSKSMDMRFYWLRDRENQGQFLLYWDRGENNLADYFTKHHSAPYHKKMRPVCLASYAANCKNYSDTSEGVLI